MVHYNESRAQPAERETESERMEDTGCPENADRRPRTAVYIHGGQMSSSLFLNSVCFVSMWRVTGKIRSFADLGIIK